MGGLWRRHPRGIQTRPFKLASPWRCLRNQGNEEPPFPPFPPNVPQEGCSVLTFLVCFTRPRPSFKVRPRLFPRELPGSKHNNV